MEDASDPDVRPADRKACMAASCASTKAEAVKPKVRCANECSSMSTAMDVQLIAAVRYLKA